MITVIETEVIVIVAKVIRVITIITATNILIIVLLIIVVWVIVALEKGLGQRCGCPLARPSSGA